MTSNQPTTTTTTTTGAEEQPHQSRLHLRRRTDSFFSRFSSSPAPSFPTETECIKEDDKTKSLAERLLTPLYLLSYILSLFYISQINNSRRAKLSSSSPHELLDARTQRQDVDTGAWHGGHTNVKETSGGGGWFVKKKHRLVAGMEIEQAERIQGVVMGWILGVVGMAIAGFSVWAMGVFT